MTTCTVPGLFAPGQAPGDAAAFAMKARNHGLTNGTANVVTTAVIRGRSTVAVTGTPTNASARITNLLALAWHSWKPLIALRRRSSHDGETDPICTHDSRRRNPGRRGYRIPALS